MTECPALLMCTAALLLDGALYLPSEPGLSPGAPTFRLADAPGGTIEFGHAREFPVGPLIEDHLQTVAHEYAFGGEGELAVVAELAEDVARQWQRSRRQGLPYDTRNGRLLDRLRGEITRLDVARLVPDEALLWFRWVYALVPQADGPISARGRRYQALGPLPVQRWWSSLRDRTARLVRTHLCDSRAALAPDPRPLERLRTRLAESHQRVVRLVDDPPLSITWDQHESLMTFSMSFPGFAQQDRARHWYLFPPGRVSLRANAARLRAFALAPEGAYLQTLVEMPSAPHIVHPFVSSSSRSLCSAGNVESIFHDPELTPAAMILLALERGVGVLLTGQGAQTHATPYREFAESGAPLTTRAAAEDAGLLTIPWVNAERGRKLIRI